MKKKSWITLSVIIGTILLSIIILNHPTNSSSEEITKCIGKNSELYIQLGCHACETQEDMFGENYQYLNVIDCFYENDKCLGITATPTWIIKGEKHVGVQSIEALKEFTGC